MALDHALVNRLRGALIFDPHVDADSIVVSGDDEGRVTLSGVVGSLRERREAERTVDRVLGVVDVDNRLRVSSGRPR